MSDIEQPIESGITRRDLLKRGTVLGGALAWGTPVVQIIGMRPALASVTSPDCVKTFCIKSDFDPQGNLSWSDCGEGNNCLAIEGAEFDSWDGRTIGVEFVDCPQHPDPCASHDPNDADGLVPGIRLTLPVGCELALIGENTGTPDAFTGDRAAAAKCGLKGGPLTDACDPPTLIGETGDGRQTVCFPIECCNGTSISHIELILCCQS